jgi:hypothetical protein
MTIAQDKPLKACDSMPFNREFDSKDSDESD